MNYNIYTRSWMGLDARVWVTLGVTVVLSIAVLSFTVLTEKPCVEFAVAATTSKGVSRPAYYIGETVLFHSSADVMWDFGDHQEGAGKAVQHNYFSAGTYTVTVTVNGHCTQQVVVTVKPLPQAAVVPVVAIDGPEAPEVGEKAEYECPIPSGHYEWTVLNSPNFGTQEKEKAVFSFPTPGTRILELRLDNDPSKVFHKTIDVLPAEVVTPRRTTDVVVPRMGKPKTGAPVSSGAGSVPVAEPIVTPVVVAPAEHKAPAVTDDKLKSLLESVAKGSFTVDGFNQYLCNGAATKAVVNGKQRTLQELCDQIKDRKRVVIKTVTTERDSRQCVTVLHVEYKKKGLF